MVISEFGCLVKLASGGFIAKFAQAPKGDNERQMINVMLGGNAE
jgi:hypothetical protein